MIISCNNDDEPTPTNQTSATVISTNPQNNEMNVACNKVISITFNEEMDPTSFTSTSFTLKQGTTTVPGAVEYFDNSAQFIPTNTLSSGTTYTAKVNTSVKDLAGNPMANDMSWTFTTGTETGLSVVNLRASANYVILAKTAINNAPTSAITGDMGLSPSATFLLLALV